MQTYQGLSTATKPVSERGSIYHETDTGDKYEYDGDSWVQTHSNGNTLVSDVGISGQIHNRLIATAGSTLPAGIATATWTEEQIVYNVRFKITGGTAGHRVRIVFDASPVDDSTDTVQAANWLAAATASETLDVQYFEVAQGGANGASEWSEWFKFTSPIRRVDAISVDADVAQTIMIEVG